MRLLLLIIFIYCCNVVFSQSKEADLIVHNAMIYTVDSTFSKAQALAVKDGKIVAVGSNNVILNSYTAKEETDAHGRTVYPGFIDAHSHFMEYGESLFAVDLYDVKSTQELVTRVQQFAAAHPNMQWITGRG